MRWKTTLVLLIAAVALGSYVSLYELKQPTPEERHSQRRQVLRIDPDEVEKLLIELPSTRLTLEQHDGRWRCTSPLSARADSAVVWSILDALSPLDAQAAMEDTPHSPINRAAYGLAPSQGTLTILSGSQATMLEFGAPSAVGDGRYAALAGTPKVFVIDNELFETLDAPIDAYRSHELLDFDTWRITQIVVSAPARRYSLRKDGERWRVVEPLEDVVDGAALSSLLNALRGLRAQRFITEAPQVEQVTEWGFQTPAVHVRLEFEEGSEALELFVGKPTSDNPEQLYAKRTDEATIYAVEQSSVEGLLKNPQSLRSRACFEFFVNQLTKIHVTTGATSWSLEQRDGQWVTADGTALEASTFEEWLWKLRETKLIRFVEDGPQDLSRYGLSPPQDRIDAWIVGQEQPEALLVGQTADPEALTRYGQCPGRPSVVELPASLTELLATAISPNQSGSE